MTNKEAIYRQDVLDLAKKGVLISNGNYESVCKAINELPPVTPQPCEDAIDRAEAVRVASGYCHPANVAKELAKLPAVNPQEPTDTWSIKDVADTLEKHGLIGEQEPKTGHWIENAPEYQNIDPPYICSECGNMHLRKTNYCDQCGAKMIEPRKRSGVE